MSDTKTGEDGEASAGRSKTLSLKRTVESGQVRQSFSHGRSKSVLVEKRRKRTINSSTAEAAPAAEEAAPEAPAPAAPQDNLSKTQQDRRQAAVVEAKQRAIEEAKQSEIDARRRAEEDARRAEEEALGRWSQRYAMGQAAVAVYSLSLSFVMSAAA